jgi:predicted RNA-binding protein YlqC (UPF0109 family)
MKELLSYLVTQLVDNPEAVQVEELNNPQEGTTLILHVDQSDMGKVIGRGGKIIRALRLLLKVKAIKTHQRVRLEIAEPQTPSAE